MIIRCRSEVSRLLRQAVVLLLGPSFAAATAASPPSARAARSRLVRRVRRLVRPAHGGFFGWGLVFALVLFLLLLFLLLDRHGGCRL